jgi:hypothetical protein
MIIFLITPGGILEVIVALGAIAIIVYLSLYLYDRRLNIRVLVTDKPRCIG